MAEFRVRVEEVLCRIVEVEAADEREAQLEVERMYADGDIVLDESDFVGEADFSVVD